MMKSADHQVRSLLDVISFILESLSASEAQTFETEIFSEYFRKHFDLLDKKKGDIQDSSSVAGNNEVNDFGNLDDKDTADSPPPLGDEVSSNKPLIISENSLNDLFFDKDDQIDSPSSLSPIPFYKEQTMAFKKDDTSKDISSNAKIIIFDPFTENHDLEEYEKEEQEESVEILKKMGKHLVIRSKEDENKCTEIATIEDDTRKPLQENVMRGVTRIGNEKKRSNQIYRRQKELDFKILYQDSTKVGDYQCSICSTEFSLKNELLIHYREKHQTLLCSHDKKCTFVAATQEDIDEHIDAVHNILSIKETFQCPHCPHKNGFLGSALARHVRNEHDPDLDFRTCPICFKKFTIDASVEYHIEKNHSKIRPDCKICEKKFSSLTVLKRHLERHHTCATRKMVVCEICGKEMVDGIGYKRHMEAHKAIGKQYQCSQCDKKYSTKFKLTLHTNEVHRGEDILCTQCDYRTKNKKSFIRHLIKHSEERPFSCEKCGLAFKCKNTFNSHKRIHTGEKKYECGVCGKKFRAAVNLRTHERIHQNKPQAYCNLCDKHFIQSYNYKMHVKKHHMSELEKLQDDPHLKEEQLN